MVAPTHATGKNAPLSARHKNVGADSISARARLRQDKLPRAHIECAPTGLAFDKGRKLHAGHRPLLAPSARGLRPQAVGERTVRRAGIFRAQTGENSCRGEHCSPVPACLTRQLSRKMRCGGKSTGDQWSPLHTQQGKRAPLRPHKKRRGGFHIRPCPLALQDNCPGKCVAAVSWRATNGRPYTRDREKRASSPPQKRRGGFHIRPCPLAVG